MTTKILEHMKDIWINVQVYYDQVLGPDCSCSLSGCEFDYQTNTYRLQVSTQLVLMSWHKLLSKFFSCLVVSLHSGSFVSDLHRVSLED